LRKLAEAVIESFRDVQMYPSVVLVGKFSSPPSSLGKMSSPRAKKLVINERGNWVVSSVFGVAVCGARFGTYKDNSDEGEHQNDLRFMFSKYSWPNAARQRLTFP
jgi:hypothetical protein